MIEITSNNQNLGYINLFPWIKKRWDQLGIKSIYVSCSDTDKFYHPEDTEVIEFKISNNTPLLLDKHFEETMSRFWIASTLQTDETVVISDGDLMPINKKYIYKPGYNIDIESMTKLGNLVSTNIYPTGDILATYIYGKPRYFKELLFPEFDTFEEVLEDANELAYNTGTMFLKEEKYLNRKLKQLGYWESRIVRTDNRNWTEKCQEMNNLYQYQIDLLKTPGDLAPFIEFHGMRSQYMTVNRWTKLFDLLSEFDKLDITPNNYFWSTVKDKWKDTIITKDGYVVLGDEYNNIYNLKGNIPW